jgi:rhodanese-related sulfurtransferase
VRANPVNAWKLLHLLLITLALAGYAAYLRSERERPPAPAAVPSGVIPLLRAAEAEELWRHDGTLFVDVRSAADYADGHIAGAVSLPEEEIEQRLAELRPRLEAARAIVVYCKSEDCGKSLWAAIRLRNEGLTQTRIYPAGWYDWKRHGLPHTAAP